MAEGTVVVRVYTSRAQIPVENTTVAFTRYTPAGPVELLAVRLTNESGRTEPLAVEAPEASESRAPEPGQPYTLVNIEAWHPDYAGVLVERVQVFDGQQTLQAIELIPLAEYPDSYSETEVFDLPQQNL